MLCHLDLMCGICFRPHADNGWIEFSFHWDCTQLIFLSSIVINILEVQCIQLILFENSYFFLTDSVEDGEKLVKTALEAFGRIGTVA